MLIVIALGGNAVSLPGTEGNIPEQFAATRAAMKPVGPFMSKEVADRHVRDDKWKIAEDDARGGWRRVVPSPAPREIIELPLLKALVANHHIIIAAGGGGVPVARDSAGHYRGV